MSDYLVDFIHNILLFCSKLLILVIFFGVLIYPLVKQFEHYDVMANEKTKVILYDQIKNPLTFYKLIEFKLSKKNYSKGDGDDVLLMGQYAESLCFENGRCPQKFLKELDLLREKASSRLK